MHPENEEQTRARVVRAAFFVALLASTPLVARAPEPGPPGGDETSRRAEAALARDLARIDEELGLKSSPDSSPLWTARLAAAIEARGKGQPAQELLRGLVADLRRLHVALRHEGGTPPAGEIAARESTVLRIRNRVDLVLRKLGLSHLAGDGKTRSLPDAPQRHAATATYRSGEDDCSAPVQVGLGVYRGSTGNATVDGDASCAGPVATPDVWYRFIAPETGSYTFATRRMHGGTLEDSVLSLHSGCPLAGGDLHEVGCSDDGGDGLFSSVTTSLTAGEEILIRISGFGGDTGSFEMTVSQGRAIRGRVLEAATGIPVAGASVVATDRWEEVFFESSAASDGRYRIDVPNYGIEFYAKAWSGLHAVEWYDGYDCTYGEDCSRYGVHADPISVASGNPRFIDFELEPAGSIAGRVTTSDSTPPEDLYITIHLFDDNGRRIRSFTARSDGSYHVPGIVPGTYYVQAEVHGYRSEVWDSHPCSPCDPTTGEPLVVAAGSRIGAIDFELEPLGSISGKVLEQGSGDPAGGRVELYRADGSFLAEEYLHSDGQYSLESVLPGDYFIRTVTYLHLDELYDDVPCDPECDVSTGTPLAVSLGTRIEGVDFHLAPQASIAGSVLEQGTGLSVAMTVFLYDGTGAFLTQMPVYKGNETYRFDGLAAGTYYVKAGYVSYATTKTHAQELYDDLPCLGECDPTAGTPIVLGGSTTAGAIDFQVVPRGSIMGQVRNARSGEPVTELVWVQAYFTDGTKAGQGSVQPDGTFEIPYLTAADYHVGTSSLAWKDEMYDDVLCGSPCDRTSGTAVPVQSGTVTPGVDFALDRWGSITGHVQGSPNSTVSGRVQLFDSSGTHLVDQEVFFNSGSAPPSPYAFHHLAPGTYFVKTDELGSDQLQGEVFSNLPCEPTCDVTTGTPIRVSDGEPVTGIDFSLASCS